MRQNNFKFAFGSLRRELPLNVGRLKSTYNVEKTVDGRRKKIREILDVQKCDIDDHGVKALNNLDCLRDLGSNIELNGQYFTEQFSYIEIKLELCPSYNEELGIECLSAAEIKQFFEEKPYVLSFNLVKRIFTQGNE